MRYAQWLAGILVGLRLGLNFEAALGEPAVAAAWEGLSWGMTKQEIAARLPAAREYSVDFGNSREEHLFGIPNYQVAGCPAKLAFQFKNDKLDHITLDFALNDPRSGRCEGEVAQDLTRRYGKPVSFEVQRKDPLHIERGEWLSAAARINYHAMSARIGRDGALPLELSVTYLPRQTGGAGKL